MASSGAGSGSKGIQAVSRLALAYASPLHGPYGRARRGLFMVPLIGFLVLVIDLYIWVVIASAILSWLIAFNVVNTNNRIVLTIADALYRITEPALRPIRSILPNLGGIDISPVILILLLLFIRDVVLLGWILPAVV
jgi:YggT family protein